MRGFTLLEVLIALAITAFVSMVAYTSISAALAGVESLRENAGRTYDVNRAWMFVSRDLRQLAQRPVRDEFGQIEPILAGGELARFPLSFTRTGWHNPHRYPRSHLQRVNYRVEDEALWRDTYPVLDRDANTEAQTVKLLEGVEYMELKFLGDVNQLSERRDDEALRTDDWADNWVHEVGAPGGSLAPPAAIEIRLQLTDWGEMRRLYALPPL
ncbi:MAG: type II secretion system minor pseudopilin GspJ [Halioglobus sp.]|nr:type II secretion system minor pseudopilin GspJ [Halioglobus sp.]